MCISGRRNFSRRRLHLVSFLVHFRVNINLGYFCQSCQDLFKTCIPTIGLWWLYDESGNTHVSQWDRVICKAICFRSKGRGGSWEGLFFRRNKLGCVLYFLNKQASFLMLYNQQLVAVVALVQRLELVFGFWTIPYRLL